jgi:hypothetical protein
MKGIVIEPAALKTAVLSETHTHSHTHTHTHTQTHTLSHTTPHIKMQKVEATWTKSPMGRVRLLGRDPAVQMFLDVISSLWKD